MIKIDILVLNYNRKDLLGLYLPSICAAAKGSSNRCGVSVVDNVSTDGSPEFVKKNFPEVHIFSAKSNRVLFSYNDIIKDLDSDVVVFMNNDIKVKEDFVDLLAAHFSDPAVFFVAPCVLNMDGSYNGGKSHFEFRWGMIKSVVESASYDKPGSTQTIACGAFRRDMFIELGGFDDLYYPGIWEDADVCYRGLKKGYKGVYEPRSIIWHDESTTFNKVYGNRERMILAHRNMFLFLWKNITDSQLMIVHMVMLIPVMIGALIKNKREFITGFFRALSKMRLAVKSRKNAVIAAGGYLLSDRQIIR